MAGIPSLNHLESDFGRKLNQLAHGRTYSRVFGDGLEIAAIITHQQPYQAGLLPRDPAFETLERQYLEIIPAYQPEELTRFAEMYGIAQIALAAYQTDFFGKIYQELGIGGKERNGEFFTPPNIARAMVRMTLTDVEEIIEEKGYLTLNEPACGAGGLIIAAAEYLNEKGYDPRRTLLFQATDINRDCFNMTYIQTSLMALVGTVRHGNTLTQDIWETRATPQWRVNQVVHNLDPFLKVALSVERLIADELETAERDDSSAAVSDTPPEPSNPEPKTTQEPSPEEYEQLNLFDLRESNEGIE